MRGALLEGREGRGRLQVRSAKCEVRGPTAYPSPNGAEDGGRCEGAAKSAPGASRATHRGDAALAGRSFPVLLRI